jgi:hypothetical protein
MLRWQIVFKNSDSSQYASQLSALGAILAVPAEGAEGRYRVFHDLEQRPLRGRLTDFAGIDRIYWVDDQPESVASLARALGIDQVPAHIIVLLPRYIENELLRKELAFAGRDEEDIDETRFEFRQTRRGCEIAVVDQRAKPEPSPAELKAANARLWQQLRKAQDELDHLARQVEILRKSLGK